MTLWENWVRHPQSLWLRRALFRVHRWTGIGAGLYILAMSSTGSLIVYRDELTLALSAPVIVASQGTRMPLEELKQAARQHYPEYQLTKVYQATNPNQAVEITFERGGKSMERLFDPYTGADLGNRLRTGFRLLLWLVGSSRQSPVRGNGPPGEWYRRSVSHGSGPDGFCDLVAGNPELAP